MDADNTVMGKVMVPPPRPTPPNAGLEADRTLVGKPMAPPPPLATPKGNRGIDRRVTGKPVVPPPLHPPGGGLEADRTIVGKPAAPPPLLPPSGGLEADRTVMGQPAAPPPLAPDRGASLPAQPDAGEKPRLRCPQCTRPFRIPRERIGKLTKCSECNCLFRVVEYTDGNYGVRQEGVLVRQPTPEAAPPLNQPPAEGPGDLRFAVNPPVHGAAAATPAVSRGRGKRKLGLGVVLALVGLCGLAAAAYFFLFREKAVSLGKYGGIEIGSTGVKMIALEYYDRDGEVAYRILAEPKDVNTNVSAVLAGKNKTDFNQANLDRTVGHVRDYFEELRDRLGVPPENIYIACSSGVLAPFRDEADRQRNRKRLEAALRDRVGKTIEPEFIGAHREARYIVQAIVPRKDWQRAVVIDVGGENAKGGGYDDRGNFQHFEVRNAGVKSFEKLVAKNRRGDESFPEAARRLARTDVRKRLQEELAEERAVLRERKQLYFLGGIAWALASYTRPKEFYFKENGKHPTYRCKMSSADLARFDKMVLRKPEEVKGEILSRLAGEGDWVRDVKINLDKIQKVVFRKTDRLVGGAQLLRTIHDEFGGEGSEDKEVFGFRYGHVAWLIGYVGNKSGRIK
jgi:hypothetical protein